MSCPRNGGQNVRERAEANLRTCLRGVAMWNEGRSRLLIATLASALVLAACGTANNSTSPTALNGPLTFGSDSSFTGPNASFGLEQVAGCYTAVSLINQGGGMFGQQ